MTYLKYVWFLLKYYKKDAGFVIRPACADYCASIFYKGFNKKITNVIKAIRVNNPCVWTKPPHYISSNSEFGGTRNIIETIKHL